MERRFPPYPTPKGPIPAHILIKYQEALQPSNDGSKELSEKRPLDESAEDNGDELKKSKTDDKEVQAAISKRQRKLAIKQQKWLEDKERRR